MTCTLKAKIKQNKKWQTVLHNHTKTAIKAQTEGFLNFPDLPENYWQTMSAKKKEPIYTLK